MSFFLTTPQVQAGDKDVTRRMHWVNLLPGTYIQAVVKSQGLKKGERVQIIRTIKVKSVRREPLDRILDEPEYGREEVRREGFKHMTPQEFVDFFCRANHCTPGSIVTRIEFEYPK